MGKISGIDLECFVDYVLREICLREIVQSTRHGPANPSEIEEWTKEACRWARIVYQVLEKEEVDDSRLYSQKKVEKMSDEQEKQEEIRDCMDRNMALDLNDPDNYDEDNELPLGHEEENDDGNDE